MKDVDVIRTELYDEARAFVTKLKTADRADPQLRTEAIVRLNKVFKYASLQGRGRFLEMMKLPGAAEKRRQAYEECIQEGGAEEACVGVAERLPAFRDIFEAWPPESTVSAWWAAPITHLIGTYDQKNKPAGELSDWRDEASTLAKAAAIVADGADTVGEAVSEAVDDVLEPEDDSGFPWWKAGVGVAATALVSACVYRIVNGPAKRGT